MGRRHDAGVRGQPGYVRAVVAFAADVSAAEGTIFTLNFRALQGGSTMVYLSGESYLTGVPLSLHPVASITVESGSPVIPPPYDPDRPGGETDIPDEETPGGDQPHPDGECPSAVFTDVTTDLWYHGGVAYVV